MHFDAFVPAFLIFVVLGVVMPLILAGTSMANRNTEY
jgi:hypothetical protein